MRVGALTILLMLAFVAGCAHRSSKTVARPTPISSAEACRLVFSDKAARVSAMNSERPTEADLSVLRKDFPVPRIIAINGSIPLSSMDSFTGFLTALGYPEEKTRNPLDGSGSYSSYLDSAKLAGIVAWFFEKDGVMPLVIGHSQGGMLVVKLLHELSGSFGQNVAVWNPYDDTKEERVAILDPVTGREQPIIGLKVRLASAIATGRVMRLIMGQWDMLKRLRQIPDSVVEFSGYHLPNDPISGTVFGVGRSDWYHPTGSAVVHNIILADGTGHFSVISEASLLNNQEVRQWIETYNPAKDIATPLPATGSGSPLLAADIWLRIETAWIREVQEWIAGKRRVCET